MEALEATLTCLSKLLKPSKKRSVRIFSCGSRATLASPPCLPVISSANAPLPRTMDP